jgi:hypothetical protein
VREAVAPKSDGTGEEQLLAEVDVDLARTTPRAVLVVIVPVIGPAVPIVVVTVASTMPVVIAIRLAVVPDEALEETTEAALARAVALIAIE